MALSSALDAIANDDDFELSECITYCGLYPNARTSDGFSLLYHAAKLGRDRCASYLLTTGGAKPNPLSPTKETPLMVAARHGHLKIVEMIMDSFPLSARFKDLEGQTVVHKAVLSGCAILVSHSFFLGKVRHSSLTIPEAKQIECDISSTYKCS